VLHKACGQHQCPDGHIFKAARYAYIQHHIGGVAADKQLGRHGGIHLAHASGTGHYIFTDLVKGCAGYLFYKVGVFAFQQALDFAVHGVHHAYFHGVVSFRFQIQRVEKVFSPRRLSF